MSQRGFSVYRSSLILSYIAFDFELEHPAHQKALGSSSSLPLRAGQWSLAWEGSFSSSVPCGHSFSLVFRFSTRNLNCHCRTPWFIFLVEPNTKGIFCIETMTSPILSLLVWAASSGLIQGFTRSETLWTATSSFSVIQGTFISSPSSASSLCYRHATSTTGKFLCPLPCRPCSLSP